MRKGWLVLLTLGLLLLPACRAGDSAKNEMIQEQKGDSKAMQPVSSGYVDVNGVKIYHEIYGSGEPVVLLHGGLMTTKEMSSLIQALSGKRRVIAVELELDAAHRGVLCLAGVSIEKFLDDPMTKPQGGEAAAASKVSQ